MPFQRSYLNLLNCDSFFSLFIIIILRNASRQKYLCCLFFLCQINRISATTIKIAITLKQLKAEI